MRPLICLWALAGCETSSTTGNGRLEAPYYSTMAACPVYEGGQLVGADVIFYYEDPEGGDPQLADFFKFGHSTFETGEVVRHEGLLVETEGGESTILRPQVVSLERRSLFETPWAGSAVFVQDLGQPGPLFRADTPAMLNGLFAPFYVGGIVFSEEVVAELAITSEARAIYELVTGTPPNYIPFLLPRFLNYRAALARATAMLAGRDGVRLVLLDTGHRVFPEDERLAYTVPAGHLADEDMAAIAADLRASRTVLIAVQQAGEIDPPRRIQLDLVEPDLQRLACQSGGFLAPATFEPSSFWDRYNVELALRSFWRLRIAWPAMDAQPVTITGWVANRRTVAALGYIQLAAAWRQTE